MTTPQTVTKALNQSFPIRGHFTCQSANIVYTLQCDIRDIKYNGETSNTKKKIRFGGHESSINTFKDLQVTVYYSSYNHTIKAPP